VIFGLSPEIDFDLDGAGRMSQVTLNTADVKPAGLEMPKRFLTEAIVTDTAGNDAGIAEQRRDVCEIRGAPPSCLPFGKRSQRSSPRPTTMGRGV